MELALWRGCGLTLVLGFELTLVLRRGLVLGLVLGLKLALVLSLDIKLKRARGQYVAMLTCQSRPAEVLELLVRRSLLRVGERAGPRV